MIFRILLGWMLLIFSYASMACTLSHWSQVSDPFSMLTTPEDSAHFVDECGLRIQLAGNHAGFVEDTTPGKVFPQVSEYQAEFNVFADTLVMADNQPIEILVLQDENGEKVASFALNQQGGKIYSQLETIDSDGQSRSTGGGGLEITAGWHQIQLTWRAASSASAQDGELLILVDGTEGSCGQTIRFIHNDTQRISRARLGVVSGNQDSATGVLDFDAFSSQRNGHVSAETCPPLVTPFLLAPNQWQQISPPVSAGTTNSVRDLFADDLPAGRYGLDWILFRYDAASHSYQDPGLDGPVLAGQGYWIIQLTEGDVTLDIDDYDPAALPNDVALPTIAGVNWHMLG
ncbi:MAG TPA: hypothetical protein ENJ84_13455, partial [Gammaproteobacteria bacterium]|nr:hypothetical protein [Gammaproteobacteria bacterium]